LRHDTIVTRACPGAITAFARLDGEADASLLGEAVMMRRIAGTPDLQ
jgi:hypothetical protein